MDVEQARSFLLTLPYVVETMQWGDNLIFWVGDKAIGGKMFALIDLDGDGLVRKGVASFAAGKERAAELLERDGIFPAPYLARIGWVAAERWSALRPSEWHTELRSAHERTFAKLPSKVRKLLTLPEEELAAAVNSRRQSLASPKRAKSAPAARRKG